MKSILSTDYKKWLSDNLEWFIEKLGSINQKKYPFLSFSSQFASQFHQESFFSSQKFSNYLIDKLELNGVLKNTSENSQIPDIEIFNSKKQIELITQEIIIAKAEELGLKWNDDEEVAAIILILATYFGLTRLLINENEEIFIRGIKVECEIAGFIIALILCTNIEEQQIIISSFPKKSQEMIFFYLKDGVLQEHFSGLKPKFKIQDEVLLQLTQARELGQKGFYALSITIIEKLCKQTPEKALFWELLGYYQQKNNLFKKSSISFRKASKINPKNADTLSYLAFNLMFLHQMDEAKNLLLKSQTMAPKNALNLRNIGIYYSILNEPQQAFIFFESSIKSNPNQEFTHYYYALALLLAQDKKKAIEHLQISVKNKETIGIKKLKNLIDEQKN